MLNLKDKEKQSDIAELLDEIISVYEGNNWLIVKKYILKYSSSEIRRLFSTRNPKTKKHSLNDFEKDILIYCKDLYKRELYLLEENKEKHDEA